MIQQINRASQNGGNAPAKDYPVSVPQKETATRTRRPGCVGCRWAARRGLRARCGQYSTLMAPVRTLDGMSGPCVTWKGALADGMTGGCVYGIGGR